MKKISRVAAAALLLGGFTTVRAEDQKILHDPLTCLPAGSNARITAEIKGPDPVTSARVYFRPVDAANDYYLEMRRGENEQRYTAVLPVPASPDTAITYRLVVQNASGAKTVTAPVKVTVAPWCSVALSDDDLKIARNLVVGLTARGQDVVPAGFRRAGIVASISAEGDLQMLPSGGEKAPAPPPVVSSRTGPAPACEGCGTLTIGGMTGTSVDPHVIPAPRPTPPISPIRPTGGN